MSALDEWRAGGERIPVRLAARDWQIFDRIAERMPAADLVRFADVGHWPQLEVPEAVRAHLRRILAIRPVAPR